MRPEIIILPALFACIAFAIKTVVDARMRGKLLVANRPDDLIRSMILSEERQRRHSSLRWGIVLSCLAAGFALIQLFGWKDLSPGVIAVVLGATGVGNIVSYLVARNLDSRSPSE